MTTHQPDLFSENRYVGAKASAEYQRQWRDKNRAKVKGYDAKRRAWHAACTARWRKKNKHKIAAAQRRKLLKTYGLTTDEYNAMVIAQQNRCAICRDIPANRKTVAGQKYTRLDVDHCHKTNRVRALLCASCNGLLGYAKDRVDVLKRAIEYLERYR